MMWSILFQRLLQVSGQSIIKFWTQLTLGCEPYVPGYTDLFSVDLSLVPVSGLKTWSYPLILALECHWPHCLHVGLFRDLCDSHFCWLILWSWLIYAGPALMKDYRFTAPFTYLSGTSSQTITLSFTMCYSFSRQLDLILFSKTLGGRFATS